MFPITLLIFVGTAISLFVTLDFIRPLRKSNPF
jgi:hypothetical protein